MIYIYIYYTFIYYLRSCSLLTMTSSLLLMTLRTGGNRLNGRSRVITQRRAVAREAGARREVGPALEAEVSMTETTNMMAPRWH